MPVKIWDRAPGGALTSRVETSRSQSYRGERYRADAEALDREIDGMLDHSIALAEGVPAAEAGPQAFVRRWSVGRALAESKLLDSDFLEPSEHKWLWLAIARKCRLGVRSDGSREENWHGLIPHRDLDPGRIELDVFAVGMWLQEQEIEVAMTSFGASLTNATEIHRRGAIRSRNLRDALALWFGEQCPTRREELTKTGNFEQLAKALVKRFPARGPGSAKRPVHYSVEELCEEVRKVLDPIASGLVPGNGLPPVANR